MNKTEMIQTLREWDQKGRYVFTHADLQKLFPQDKPKTLNEGLARIVKAGLLQHVCRGIYLNPFAHSKDAYPLEHVAKALRRGGYNYISLESMLSEYGVISQIPIDRLTVMTTGREGLYETIYGTIEFTHTARSVENILNHVISAPARPLRIATKATAWRDLKRVGRNIEMVEQEMLGVG